MALAKDEHELPNLKIEIENDLEEAMDTDDGETNKISSVALHGRTKDVEEGEVCEIKDDTPAEQRILKGSDALQKIKNVQNREIPGDAGDFVAVAPGYDNKANESFGQKGKKFGLPPDELKLIAEEKLASLYKSLGMKDDEVTEKRYRLDALHIRGTQDMSTDDVFAYFKDYSPASIEWINDYSCNIVWMSSFLAAKAIIELSRPIKGLEVNHPRDPFSDDKIAQVKRRRLSSDNVVVMVTEVEDQDNEVLMVGDEEPGEEESNKGKEELVEHKTGTVDSALDKNGGDKCTNEESAASASEIDIPIPPGLWRLGKPTPKAKHILLRYTMKTDRKPARAEKMSDYYKKHGNPNYGGIKGLITKSRKRRFREKASMDATPPKGNPWGSLAESWGNIDRRKAMQPDTFDRDSEIPLSFPTAVRVPPHGQRPIHILPLVNPPIPPKVLMRQVSGSFIQRRGSSSDPESESSSNGDGSSSTQWRRKIKQPRMRMYADEEERRVERRREQQRREAEVAAAVRQGMDLKKVTETTFLGSARDNGGQKKQIGDLRNRLSKDRTEAVKRGATTAVSAVNRRSKGTSSVWNRLAQREKALMGSDEEMEGSDVKQGKVDLRASLTKKPFEGDLRSKLNRSKTLKSSPLRIEIDNDEYYRVTGCD